MADNSEEKNLEPTHKKIQQAREEGQIAQSKDLTMLFAIVSIILYYTYISSNVFLQLSMCFSSIIFSISLNNLDITLLLDMLSQCGVLLLKILVIPICIGGFVSLIFNIIQLRGITINKKAFHVKLSKFNPISNLKEIVSKKNLLKFIKHLVEIIVMGGVAYNVFRSQLASILLMPRIDVMGITLLMLDIIGKVFVILFFIHFIFVIFDYMLEFIHTKKQLMMSESEVKQEYKNMEGNPEIKSELRRMQRELLEDESNSMDDASMVLANPTHIAIVIKYKPRESPLPIILTKANGYRAQHIFKVAQQNNIPVIKDIWLARKLYTIAQIGESVPPSLAQALGDLIGRNLHLMPVLEREFKDVYYEKMKSTEILQNPFKNNM